MLKRLFSALHTQVLHEQANINNLIKFYLINKTPADQRDIFRPKSLRRLLDNKFVPC